ncbi:MAG: hypothetical protein PHQ58_11810 [Rhodoferax sp.]|uniref:hypothetical protein n=1 Tax=Rhodoferax sp. TaxID=50421 RepID=UPI00261FDCD9|nr:hypothetical protein [Rhodoferax sp.]MDD2881112.1 hypothetical protein [Rhodoferax sp.]
MSRAVFPVSARHSLTGFAVLALILVLVWLQAPAWRVFPGGSAAPVLKPDVCIVAPPTPYDRASGLPM